MKRRVAAALISATMLLGMTVGAGAQTVMAEASETYNVEMQIVTWGTTPTGLEEVESAINAISEPEIGVTVTLNPIPAYDLVSESNLAITSGEKLDLMCILPFGAGMDSIANYTGKNMILELDDLYAEYGKDIQECIGELIEIGYLGGKLYAIPPNTVMGGSQAFAARTEILDELGITIDEEKFYTVDELEEIFAKFKEAYPNGNYAIAAFGTGCNFKDLNEVDALGGDISNGVLLDGGLSENATVENLFASEEYAEYVNRMHSWYEKGYLSPDVATITDDVTSLMSTGKYFGSFITKQPGGMEGMESNLNMDLTPIKLLDVYANTGTASLGMWAIPNTCENPEKTMQFLNLMYQDRELGNDIDSILAAGLEGKSYEIVEALEGSKAIVKYPEGVNAANVPWQQACAIYGNELTVPQFEPMTSAYYDEISTFNQNIIDSGRVSCAFGYAFDSSNVSAQMAAVQSIVSQYNPILSSGSVDPQEVLPEFLDALESAGINDIIAENQAQLDAWMEAKK